MAIDNGFHLKVNFVQVTRFSTVGREPHLNISQLVMCCNVYSSTSTVVMKTWLPLETTENMIKLGGIKSLTVGTVQLFSFCLELLLGRLPRRNG